MMQVKLNLKLFYFIAVQIIFSNFSATVQAGELQLTHDIPQCQIPQRKKLPEKYYRIAKKWKEFAWVRNVKPQDLSFGGGGDERVDGSRMYDWYSFERIDINGDGNCDLFLTSLAPYSSGGGGGVLNTLYILQGGKWLRVGSAIPENKPDGLGWGKSSNEQADFAFSSDGLLVLLDKKSRALYFIGAFYKGRDSGRLDQAGYHIYKWDATKNKLEELDKWEPSSEASQVYLYFKQHGAVDTSSTDRDSIRLFESDFEEIELSQGCASDYALQRWIYFAKFCKSRAGIGSSTAK